MGIAVVSTSKGVMSDRKARENNVGGELLCTVVGESCQLSVVRCYLSLLRKRQPTNDN